MDRGSLPLARAGYMNCRVLIAFCKITTSHTDSTISPLALSTFSACEVVRFSAEATGRADGPHAHVMKTSSSDRPSLHSAIAARRHVVGDDTHMLLTDTRTGRELIVGTREWQTLSEADGTRDLEGIRIALRRHGRRVSIAHLVAFFDTLREVDFIGEVLQAPEPSPPHLGFSDSALVMPLKDYRFRCNGAGHCCETYGSILFSHQEALVARGSCPDVLDGGHNTTSPFTPERGGIPSGPLCVTRVEGACAYLGDERRCSIHAAAGAQSKPKGCQLFPITYFHDGEHIQLSVRPECVCVFQSLDDPDAPTLEAASPGADSPLPSWVPVRQLAESVSLDENIQLTRGEYRVWRDELAGRLGDSDLITNLWQRCSVISFQEALSRVQTQLTTLVGRRSLWDAREGFVMRTLERWQQALSLDLAESDTAHDFDPYEALAFRAALYGGDWTEAPTLHDGMQRLLIAVVCARKLTAASSVTHDTSLANVLAVARATGLWDAVELRQV